MTDMGGGSIVLARFSMRDGCLAIDASLSVHDDFVWQAEVGGRSIPILHFNFQNRLDSLSAVSKLVSVIDNGTICCGNPDSKFLSLVKLRKGKFMDSSGMCNIILCCPITQWFWQYNYREDSYCHT